MFTEKQFVEETRRIINASPEYVYPKNLGRYIACSYLECNIACVFGRVLANLGMTQQQLEQCENEAIYAVLLDFDFGELVKNWALSIQSRQDSGEAWGLCLKMANSVYPDILKEFPE